MDKKKRDESKSVGKTADHDTRNPFKDSAFQDAVKKMFQAGKPETDNPFTKQKQKVVRK